jgi:hypothetical protein
MGTPRDRGYSASVEAYLIVEDRRLRVAKTNGVDLVLAEPADDIASGTDAELLIIIDGSQDSRQVTLTHGVLAGQQTIPYRDVVPF